MNILFEIPVLFIYTILGWQLHTNQNRDVIITETVIEIFTKIIGYVKISDITFSTSSV